MKLRILASFLLALAASTPADAQSIAPFEIAFTDWKTTLRMSAFSAREDTEIRSAVAAGDCAFANFAIFEIGRTHLPGAIDYTDDQVIGYGLTVDRLVEHCEAGKVRRTSGN